MKSKKASKCKRDSSVESEAEALWKPSGMKKSIIVKTKPECRKAECDTDYEEDQPKTAVQVKRLKKSLPMWTEREKKRYCRLVEFKYGGQ